MLILITGASGSGKSEYAENLVGILAQKECITEKIYLATMENTSEAAKKRILRHRKLREGKGFVTVEAPFGLTESELPKAESPQKQKRILLLECMSNLLANLMFEKQLNGEEALSQILAQIQQMADAYTHLVIVTNEIFSDGAVYTGEMREYERTLGRINGRLAEKAEVVCEVVYSIPVFLKGEAVCPC